MCKPLPKLVTMLIATSACGLTACATTMGSGASTSPPPADTFCLVAKPIYWSAGDTDETIKQVKAHNAAGKILCGWGTRAPVAGSPTTQPAATPP
jgi:hypothetical protein